MFSWIQKIELDRPLLLFVILDIVFLCFYCSPELICLSKSVSSVLFPSVNDWENHPSFLSCHLSCFLVLEWRMSMWDCSAVSDDRVTPHSTQSILEQKKDLTFSQISNQNPLESGHTYFCEYFRILLKISMLHIQRKHKRIILLMTLVRRTILFHNFDK